MTQRHRKSDPLAAKAEDEGFTAGGGMSSTASSDSGREMTEFRITRDGHRYRYNGYRYDRLADALAYARLMQSRAAPSQVPGPFTQGAAPWTPPTDDERSLMASLDIHLVDGTYRFDAFRYDRLADAVSYARLSLRRQRADRD